MSYFVLLLEVIKYLTCNNIYHINFWVIYIWLEIKFSLFISFISN